MPLQPQSDASSGERRDGCFSTTHWSVVLEAGQPGTPQAHEALAALCKSYWYPLYTYVRRSGHGPEDSQDLTQEFFARLIGKNYVAAADHEKGKFRSFLLTALKRFMANEWDRANRIKRGGGQKILSLDAQATETRYLAEPAHEMTPERLFDRRWAQTLLEQAVDRLREEHFASGKDQQFERLKVFLSDETGDGDYNSAAAALKISKGAVTVIVHRLRQRYRDLVRAEVTNTVANPAEVDEEVRHLFAALG